MRVGEADDRSRSESCGRAVGQNRGEGRKSGEKSKDAFLLALKMEELAETHL